MLAALGGGWALASRGLHPSQTPRASQLPDGCCGHRPRRPSSGRRGGRGARVRVVADSGFLSVDLELPVPSPPQHVVKPRVFRVSAGGRGGRERALPHYFLPQVLFHSRARALTQSQSRPHPTWLSVCSVVVVLLAQEKSSRSEPSIWEASVKILWVSRGLHKAKSTNVLFSPTPSADFTQVGSHR